MAKVDEEENQRETPRPSPPKDAEEGRSPREKLYPPDDWRDAEAWDRYWANVLVGPYKGYHALPLFQSFSIFQMPSLRRRGARRVLFAGNGISLEPHAWVHAGFDVTAVDISPTASRFVRELGWNDRLLLRIFVEYSPRKEGIASIRYWDEALSQKRAEDERRPGGKLAVLTEDLFTHMPSERYDALFSIRAFQGFSREDQARLTALFYEWLSPSGLCLGGGDEPRQRALQLAALCVRSRRLLPPRPGLARDAGSLPPTPRRERCLGAPKDRQRSVRERPKGRSCP